MPDLTILTADFDNPVHADAIVTLLDIYAHDPMGGGKPLPAHVKETLIPELKKRSFSLCVLAFSKGQHVGLINAFEGFSTFAARPLINLHDIIVHPDHRGLGVAQAMMAHVEAIAREKNACKLTLEVLTGNGPALKAYQSFGFENYELDPTKGHAVFLQKAL